VLSAKDLAGGRTQVLNVHRNKGMDRHLAEGDEGSSPESISGADNWPNRNGHLDNPIDSEDERDVEDE
jgi:hypothetical protein